MTISSLMDPKNIQCMLAVISLLAIICIYMVIIYMVSGNTGDVILPCYEDENISLCT